MLVGEVEAAQGLSWSRSKQLGRCAPRSAQFLDGDGQRRLLRLLRWREAYARRSDRPRSWILDNELAVAIARQPALGRCGLQQLLDATPKAPRNLGDALFEALSSPLADEADAPPARGDDRDKKQLRALQDAVAAASAELGLPEGLLASRRLLESLQDGGGWTGALAGWRRAVLEPRLSPLLGAGGAAVAQLGERHVRIVEVRGSIPLRSTNSIGGCKIRKPAPCRLFCWPPPRSRGRHGDVQVVIVGRRAGPGVTP